MLDCNERERQQCMAEMTKAESLLSQQTEKRAKIVANGQVKDAKKVAELSAAIELVRSNLNKATKALEDLNVRAFSIARSALDQLSEYFATIDKAMMAKAIKAIRPFCNNSDEALGIAEQLPLADAGKCAAENLLHFVRLKDLAALAAIKTHLADSVRAKKRKPSRKSKTKQKE